MSELQEDMDENGDFNTFILDLHDAILSEDIKDMEELFADAEECGYNVTDLCVNEVLWEEEDPDYPISAVHRAAIAGSTLVLSKLAGFVHELDFNQVVSSTGETPLHFASRFGKCPMVSGTSN